MKVLFLFIILISAVFAEFRRDSTRNIVIDLENLMIWQDDENVVNIVKNHKDAIEYCRDLELAGATDWRLPNVDELQLIVDKSNEKTSTNKAFRYAIPEHFWVSDTLWRSFNFYAKYINFVSGTPYFFNRDYKKHIRCVRDIK